MEKHEMFLEYIDDNTYYSEAKSMNQAIEMLERRFIPCYQDEEPREYLLLDTAGIERVYVKIVPV